MLSGINLSGNVEKLLLPYKFPFPTNESKGRMQQALAGCLGHCVGAVVALEPPARHRGQRLQITESDFWF